MTPTELPELVQCRFLGGRVNGGVAARMRDALARTEASLHAEFTTLEPAKRIDPDTGAPTADFAKWCDVRTVGGYRASAGLHSKGIAVDLDYGENPYIATRTGQTLGGERAGARLLAMRRDALAACDRAMTFVARAPATANLAARGRGEKTSDVYDRFQSVSTALARYLGVMFRKDLPFIHRVPVLNAADASLGAFDVIDDDELLPATDALDALAGMGIKEPPAERLQILRDYELVRAPMCVGAPAASPHVTRNPARGFLTIPRHVVVALCDAARMRWGACDFGAAESGDMMHFDLGRRPT